MSASANRLSNHAALLLNSTNRHTALALFKRAANLEPSAPILCNLAIALTNFGEYAEASKILTELLSRDKNDLAAWHAYGVLSLVAGLPEDAVSCFKNCVNLDPSSGVYKFDYALALMQSGRWVEGFAAYESRKDYKPERIFPGLPRWTGESSKVVYVWAEQGIGDTFQFARYLPLVAARSKRTILAIPPSLWSLFEGYRECGVELLKLGLIADDVEAEVSLMSLPSILGASPEHWPIDPGFLGKTVAPATLGVESSDKLKVGLCWACSGASHHAQERSVFFQEIVQLVAVKNIDCFSLQVGAAAADITKNQAQLVITDLSANLTDDWAATAAAIKALDVVVATDTSVAHLAAILGKPTIMLLARRDWWRWGNNGDKTSWYPTMTIIRQQTPFSWVKEIQQASTILGHAAQARCAKAAA